MPWRTALAVDSDRPNGEDRAAVFPTPFGALAVVADGVGGRSGGAEAADAVIRAVGEIAVTTAPFDITRWLKVLDRRILSDPIAGETTAVITVLSFRSSLSRVIGDSVVWAVYSDTLIDVTRLGGAEPWRKPWLGSGAAKPAIFFTPVGRSPTLLFATDGLVKYADQDRIAAVVRSTPFDAIPRALIELVRYPSGRLPDDVAVIVAQWADG